MMKAVTWEYDTSCEYAFRLESAKKFAEKVGGTVHINATAHKIMVFYTEKID